ncbi:hypothetical protein ACQPUL_08510 [Clostridium butyricum]|uniref:hypothetical protein n=1 Tax=Clostridium butyricum TaxID=1492 RepID=UPI003D335354
MASVIIKNEQSREEQAYVMRKFGVNGRGTQEQREAAEVIAARSREAMKMAEKMGGRR